MRGLPDAQGEGRTQGQLPGPGQTRVSSHFHLFNMKIVRDILKIHVVRGHD